MVKRTAQGEKRFKETAMESVRRLRSLQQRGSFEDVLSGANHEKIMAHITNLLKDLGFRVKNEVWLFKQRDALIDFVLTGKLPALPSGESYEKLPRLDIVGILAPEKQKPNFLMGIEVSRTTLQDDIRKLKDVEFFDSILLVTNDLNGSVDGLRIVSLDKFLSVLIGILKSRL